ncbi:hypothetical protein JOD31_001703 [Methylopila capsulata]|uniref:DUF1883 domain-containing protein n=1 Tax=Methylopila capsulata TaxID=61654 RepID=A0A9W6MR15_9HYPH|nr:DUF1883 domain-containing protein [Methylopila capsulata]MBM7851478.1 hypothetical protein [Methylopila capsulata]GLK54536.1 hypothetical protein GCM10008170_05550 [Methylopila capsulata]
MSFIHGEEHLSAGDVVVVDCDHQVNVLLLDDTNFSYYRRGQRFQYHGGFYDRFPVRITAPSTGDWNIVIALPPGRRANIRYNISVVR